MTTQIASLNAQAIQKSIYTYTGIDGVRVRTLKSGFTKITKAKGDKLNDVEKTKIVDFCRTLDIQRMFAKNINSYGVYMKVTESAFDCGFSLDKLVRIIEDE
jgi:hypothetical protein